ncbi:MAG: hypothetical protein AAGF78_02825 [Pseudomonadota bacterium]
MTDLSTNAPQDGGLDTLQELMGQLTKDFDGLLMDPALDSLAKIFREKERRPPGVVSPSSFLYMRTLDADLGDRPLAPGRHWHAPDLNLTPVSNPGQITTDLEAGESYEIACTLRNRGDLRVPNAQVELFLTDPTLGFDTRHALNLTGATPLGGTVPGFGQTTLTFPYKVPNSESGHKCLFARAYSFMPQEIPVDPYVLDPRMDRRIAQQNLNIAAAEEPFPFQIVHPLNGRVVVDIQPIAAAEAQRFPQINQRGLEVRDAREFPIEELSKQIENVDGADVEVTFDDGGLQLSSKGEGPGPDERLATDQAMSRAVAARATGEMGYAEFKRLQDVYRADRSRRGVTRFMLHPPDFGLDPGTVLGLNVTARDPDLRNAALGGIVLFLTAPR